MHIFGTLPSLHPPPAPRRRGNPTDHPCMTFHQNMMNELTCQAKQSCIRNENLLLTGYQMTSSTLWNNRVSAETREHPDTIHPLRQSTADTPRAHQREHLGLLVLNSRVDVLYFGHSILHGTRYHGTKTERAKERNEGTEMVQRADGDRRVASREGE